MDTEPIRTLLLEDDIGDARLLELSLMSGAPGEFHLTRVQRLGDAIERLRQEPFDIVVSDLNVPDSSGLATFNRMQAAAPDVPIVVLSSHADAGLAIKALTNGAHDFLVKHELDGEQMVHTLRTALEQSKIRRRNLRSNGRSPKFLSLSRGLATEQLISLSVN